MSKFASVVFDLGIDKQFDYRIPPQLEDSVEPGVRVYVPFRSRKLSAYVVAVTEGEGHPGAKEIVSVRDREPVVSASLIALAEWMASYYVCSLATALRCIVPSSVRKGHQAKMPFFVYLNRERVHDERSVNELCPKAHRQALALKALLSHDGPMQLRLLLRRAGSTQGSIRSLEKKGLVQLLRQRIYRDPWVGEEIEFEEHLPPTPEQANALAYLNGALEGKQFSVVLLHGITGSGKTEVYLQAIDTALKSGRGAIMLVPEIALTPQTVERFKARFAGSVAVFHSRLSDGERLDEWEKLRQGKARVVVGARSAIFAPVKDLGLIVVDEEHEHTYKQEEAPRYHARDVAVMRGKIESVTVLLGSATPSVESYRNAVTKKYALFRLPRRIQDRPLPSVTVVDMREELRRTGRMSFISRRLLKAMEERLERGEQVILFLNRRGFSPVLICGKCGHVQKCPNCSLSLTVHGEGAKLLCHLCGFSMVPQAHCPRCRSKGVRFPGIGTQKLELLMSKLFPGQRAGRMDADSMTGKHAHAETLAAFARGEIKILIGTQMIAKGLHFPNVTLVGVVCADTALNLPDFRAAEHTFQLITQVAGRAGRGDVPGEVIVQTYAPRHPSLVAASTQDYELFYRREIPFREELGYPPVKRFVIVTVRGRSEEAVKWVSRHLARMLKEGAGDVFELLGPAPSPIARAKGYYRWQMIMKGERVLAMNEILRPVISALRPGRNVQIVVDADPSSML